MKQVIIPDRVQKEMLADFMITEGTSGLIGGYCEDEFPVYYANEEIFSREHNTTTGKVGGTGLGMPIVKKMVDLMGGSIEVESELGKGTIFTFTLMHKMADREYYNQKIETVEASDRGENLRGKHVLLAEDNDLNAEIAVTANAFAEDRKRAFDAGMNGHIAKPIDIEKLEAVILSVLNER